MKKTASVVWHGGFKDGKGAISTQTGVLKDAPYGVAARFENGPGTNPEELIGAAHASCFTMALTLVLGEMGLVADSIQTRAEVTLDKDGAGYTITGIHLDVTATIPGADAGKFEAAANGAKAGCPVSKALAGTKITMDARLA